MPLILASTVTGTRLVQAQEVKSFSAATPEIVWSKAIGAEDSPEDEIDGISVDPKGNTIIAGVFRGSVELGGRTFESRGEGDIFLASIAPDGSYRWASRFGAKGDDNAFDVTTDGAGNIYMSGWFAGSVDFGGVTLASQGGEEMVVAKFDPNGNLIWAKRLGGTGGDGGNEISVTASGEIAVTAITNSDEFEAGGKRFKHGGGARDSLIIRMSTNGDVLWAVPANGSGSDRIRAMTMTEAGDIYAGFQFKGQLKLGGHELNAVGEWDGAISRITPDGKVALLMQLGGPGHDGVRGVAATDDGQIYVSGIADGGAKIAGQDVPSRVSAVDYLLKMDANGRPAWVLSMIDHAPGNNGGEIIVDSKGPIISTLAGGEMTIRRNREVVATLSPTQGRATSVLAGFTHDGRPRFVFRPTPAKGEAGALGDVLSVSRDGRYLAQALRFRGQLGIGGTRLNTQSDRDSAVLLLRLNGA